MCGCLGGGKACSCCPWVSTGTGTRLIWEVTDLAIGLGGRE